MASISKRPNGSYDLQFVDLTKARRTIRLGPINQKQAQAFKVRVEGILEARRSGSPLDAWLAEWLGGLPREIHAKLVRYGLATARLDDARLGEFLDAYIAGRPDVKAGTRYLFTRTRSCLVEHFGADCPLTSVTPERARAWRHWFATLGNRRNANRTTTADATVRKRTGIAKQFFAEAIDRGLIARNPFEGLASTARGNPGRQVDVRPPERQHLGRAPQPPEPR